MNLEAMSKEQLIKELKRHMILCTETFTIELGTGKIVTFNKDEHYYIEQDEGGTYIISDNWEVFDVCDEDYENVFYTNFEVIEEE